MGTKLGYLKTKIKVTFNIENDAAQGAKEIYLLCEHNGWDPIALQPGTKSKEGTFSTTIELDKKDPSLKDKYQYRFQYIMHDGSEKFDNDWHADGYCANPFGGENSYFVIAEPAEEVKAEEPVAKETKKEAKAPAAKKTTTAKKATTAKKTTAAKKTTKSKAKE